MSTGLDGRREFRPVASCRIDLPEGSVHVQGVAGDAASVVVRTVDGPHGSAADPVGDGSVVVTHQDGAMSIRPGAGRGSALGGLIKAGRRARIMLEVSLPRDAAVTVMTVSANVRLRGCRGGLSVSTVTGDTRIEGAAGHVQARTVSGSAVVEGGTLTVEASTTSGRLSVDADRIESMGLRSVSGDVEVVGGVVAGSVHRIESLSGDISLRTGEGATLVARTVSGRIVADKGTRRDARNGAAVLTVGDGLAEVQARSVSGSIRLGAMPRERAAGAKDPVLDALEALARGDITVDEADQRLEVLHG